MRVIEVEKKNLVEIIVSAQVCDATEVLLKSKSWYQKKTKNKKARRRIVRLFCMRKY
jgi:hypothetical protein